jgi:ABC-type branched-subunit amino acid transport system substrate-binding protein
MTNIFNAHQRGDLGTAFGVSASRTNMKSLSDFPLLSGIMAVNPGVKYTASDLLPSLDPTKDLSVPENIPLRDFRNMDLVDVATDTPLLRMGFDNPQRKIDLAERLVGLRKAAPYAALGLLGADIAQDAVRQKGMYSAKPFKAFLDRKKKRQEKQASVLKGSTVEGLKAVGRAARSMALPAAAVGGTGFLAAKGYGAAGNYIEKQLQSPSMVAFQEAEKKRLIDEGKDPRVAENMAAKASRMAVLQAAAFPAGIGGGLLSAGISHPRTIRNIFKGQLPASGKGLISLPATAFAGYLAVPSMMGRAEEVRLGKDLSDQSPLTVPFKGSKIEKFVRDNPEYAGIPDLAVMGTIPLLTTYVGKKHYSGHAAMAAQEIDAGAAALAGAINAVGGIKPRDLMGYLRNQREEALRARRRSTKAASAIDYDRLREFLAQKEAAASKDPRLTRAGVSGYNQVKRTPGHPTKSHIVVAKEGDRVKTIRFGQQGVKTNQTAGQREAFKSRHRKNISKGKMSAAYWADKAKWSPKKTKDKDNPNWVKGS